MLFFNRNRIGRSLKITDCKDEILCIGDKIIYRNYIGVVLYNPEFKECGIAIGSSMWYGTNPYDIKSYGKFIAIPKDNSDKKFIKKLKGV